MSNIELNYRVYGLLTQIKQLMSPLAGFPQVDGWLEELNRQMVRIGSKRFRVAVVGEFKRGKSSLINTLLQREILPADVLPTTATFNRVVFGDEPRAFLHMKDGTVEEAPIDDLAQHITKLNDKALAKARLIDEAVVEFPSMFCYDGRELIDTPGLNDTEEMTRITVGRLKEIDLAIVTVAAPYPFSATEAELIAQLLETTSVCKVIFAVTMIDQVDEEDRERLLASVAERIQKSVHSRLSSRHAEDDPVFEKYSDLLMKPLIYPLSSTEAQKALALQDVDLYEKSGYGTFTSELPSILLNSQMQNLHDNVLWTTEQVVHQFLAWMDAAPDSIRRKIQSIGNLKRTFGTAMYATLVREPAEWKTVSYPDIVRQETAPVKAMLGETRKNIPQDGRERLAYLLECIPVLFRKIGEMMDQAREVMSRELIRTSEALWKEPYRLDAPDSASAERLEGILREAVKKASPEALIRGTFEQLDAKSKDRAPFWWYQPPFPAGPDAQGFSDSCFKSFVDATLKSIGESARREDALIQQLLKETHEKHRETVQSAVMDLFKTMARAEQDLNTHLEKVSDRSDIGPLQKLAQECREIRASIREE